MQELDTIDKVEQATEWCSGMVVALKANGKVRICTKLNKSVCRERHILPSVEQTLAQIGGAKVFTKFDATAVALGFGKSNFLRTLCCSPPSLLPLEDFVSGDYHLNYISSRVLPKTDD